ncbi:hypothetical protein R3P38DRAFT_3181580 [Favolaschia claudopus]|uniref:Uncharacterized protein n=1 Tax=Favolaschia claudopus TaxID=2862362 RepID=A0AAW0CLP8_9AGAR
MSNLRFNTQAHWDRILAAPPPSIEELASDFPGYSFDTSGFGEDQEIEVTSLPPHMEARIPVSAYPRVDLTSLTTPQRPLPTLDSSYITPLSNSPGTPAAFVLKDLNSYAPYPPIDANEQNQLLPYVPDIMRQQHIAAAADKYVADVGAAAGEQWRHQMLANDAARSPVDNSGGKDGGDKKKEKKRGRGKKDKENDGGDETSGNKKAFNGDDLIMIARAAETVRVGVGVKYTEI